MDKDKVRVHDPELMKTNRIVRLALIACALCAAAGPAFAWNNHWHDHDRWRHRYGTWHEHDRSDHDYRHYDRWRRHQGGYPRGKRGPVHPLSRALPNPRLTPGALNPAVTQADIESTICVRGYSQSIRPPEAYTERLKREQIREYGYRNRDLWHYEEDHLLPLSVGGSPTSPENLWPQPHRVAGGWGSFAKDRLESQLHWLVCHRGLPLVTAQRAILQNWITAYKRYVGPVPNDHRLHWDHR